MHETPEQSRDAAFMASHELRHKARETHDSEERKRLIREAQEQETIAYATDD